MNKYIEIYEKNKKIDESLVELGEFANETKVFKYGSIKSPKDKDIILE